MDNRNINTDTGTLGSALEAAILGTLHAAIETIYGGTIGSLLAYGISYMNGLGGWSAWRWQGKVHAGLAMESE